MPCEGYDLSMRLPRFLTSPRAQVALLLAWALLLVFLDGSWVGSPARLGLALVGGALSLLYAAIACRPRAAAPRAWLPSLPAWRLLALLAIVFGLFNYYSFDRDRLTGLGDHVDPTFYYLNAKYFDELGYFDLFDAMLQADAEGKRKVVRHIRLVRNLTTYDLERAAETLARGPAAKARFSPERWQQFVHDTQWFLARKSRKSLTGHFFIDHGYNPPPPWTLVGGRITNLVPVEQVKLACLLDVPIVIFMFAMLGWAFGPDVLLICLLWWFCTFSGRWPLAGHSILRFDWIAGVVVGIAALKRGRTALAGGLMSWAVLSRILPVVFWGMAALGFATRCIRRRSLTSGTRRFLLASLATVLLVTAAALVFVGPQAYLTSARNLAMHNDHPEAYSSQKVGLGDALFFRGETTRAEMAATPCGWLERAVGMDCQTHGGAKLINGKPSGIAGKGELVAHARPWLKLAALVALVAVLIYTWRSRRPPHQLVHLALPLIWIATTPSYYYYSIRLVLVLAHAQDLRRPYNRLGLALLFLIEAVTSATMMAEWVRYGTTATISWCLLFYFAVMAVALGRETRKGAAQEGESP